jgi:hypothetical protein
VPLVVSQIRTVSFMLAVARRVPSGAHATPATTLVWSISV